MVNQSSHRREGSHCTSRRNPRAAVIHTDDNTNKPFARHPESTIGGGSPSGRVCPVHVKTGRPPSRIALIERDIRDGCDAFFYRFPYEVSNLVESENESRALVKTEAAVEAERSTRPNTTQAEIASLRQKRPSDSGSSLMRHFLCHTLFLHDQRPPTQSNPVAKETTQPKVLDPSKRGDSRTAKISVQRFTSTGGGLTEEAATKLRPV